MLIRFNVKNFLSFSSNEDDKAKEFSMISGKVRANKNHIYDDKKLKLLKFAAIYGANAAGKSNLIRAINFAKKSILTKLPTGSTNMYCKINPDNKNRESYFEFEILLNDKYYSYGFEVILNSNKITAEWLVELSPDGNEKELFSRDILNENYHFNGFKRSKALYDKLNNYNDDMNKNILFLTFINQDKDNLYKNSKSAKILQDMYRWIDDNLDITYPDMPVSDYSYYINEKNIKEVSNLLNKFGTGISNYKISELNDNELLSRLSVPEKQDLLEILEDFKNSKGINSIGQIGLRRPKEFMLIEINDKEEISAKTIKFTHGDSNTLFDLSEESDGTIRLLDLLEILLAKNDGKVFIIDELDRCLHPNLTYKFVQMFLEKAKERNIQLIVTTHESRLLDLELLRRDEVWFVDKDQTGASNIYSLEEYNERFDKKIDKAYLEGRYGGVPIFNTLFPVEGECE